MDFPSISILIFLSGLLISTVVFLIFEIYVVIIGHLKGAPYVRSSRKKIAAMIDAAAIQPGETIFDLGSGDGTLLLEAGRRGAKGVGFDINPFLVWYSRMRAKFSGLEGRIEIFRKDFRTSCLKDADVVFLYLWPETLEKLQAKLVSELKPGARVISNAFPIPGWKTQEAKNGVFLYQKHRKDNHY